MIRFLTRGRAYFHSVIKYLPHLTFVIAGAITAIMIVRIYNLAERNLVLENYLLECEIKDYIAAKLEARHD